MPRKPRVWTPGAIHHVVARGHCGAPIFATDEDRAFVVSRAARAFAETGAVCLAWSILVNHYHVLVRCQGPPGPTFARLNTAIAWRTLRRRGEHGAVFQSRYFGDTCETDAALMGRFAYVLGNPIHHRVVPSVDLLRAYAWSGLGELLGLREARWIDVDHALSMFDLDPSRAREAVLSALERKAAQWAAGDDEPASEPSSTPIANAAKTSEPLPSECAADPHGSLREDLARRNWTPSDLIPFVCRATGAEARVLTSGRKTPKETAARSIVAFLACDVAGRTMAEVAPLLGVAPNSLVESRRLGRSRVAGLGVAIEELFGSDGAGV